MNKKTYLGCFLALIVNSVPIHASLIDYGPYLYDTETGLDWYDVSATYGLSFNTVNSRLTAGWRYASNNELNTLVTNATGLLIPESGPDAGTAYLSTSGTEINSLSTLANLFDSSHRSSIPSDGSFINEYSVLGVLANQGVSGSPCPGSGDDLCRATAYFIMDDHYHNGELNQVDAAYWNTGVGVNPNGRMGQMGHYLVRHHSDTIADGLTPERPVMPIRDEEGWGFSFFPFITSTEATYIDPEVATGYDYFIDSGPLFTSLILPAIGDDKFSLYLWNGANWIFVSILHSNDMFSFDGFGVDRFRITGIETSAGLNPNDPMAFVTGLTFSEYGPVNMHMNPITTNISAIPEPTALVLMSSGLFILLSLQVNKGVRKGLKKVASNG